MATNETFNKEKEKLLSRAYLPHFPSESIEEHWGSDELSEKLRYVVESFFHNLTEAQSFASLPFRTAEAITFENLRNRLLLSEKIRSGFRPEKHRGTEFEVEIYERSAKKLKEISTNHEPTDSDEEYDFLFDVIHNANSLVYNGPMASVSETVLRQAEVMVWNSLEILVRDMIEIGLNSSSILRKNFASSKEISSSWNLKRVNLDSLLKFDFDLQNNFGSIVLSGRELSDISTIQLLVSATLGKDPQMDAMLSDKSLYNLSKRRHLIVHRRAKVDRKFLFETDCQKKIGDELESSPIEFETYFDLVIELGKFLASKVNEKLP